MAYSWKTRLDFWERKKNYLRGFIFIILMSNKQSVLNMQDWYRHLYLLNHWRALYFKVSRKHGLDWSHWFDYAKHCLCTTTDANLHLVYLNSTRGQHVFNVWGICSIFKPLSDFWLDVTNKQCFVYIVKGTEMLQNINKIFDLFLCSIMLLYYKWKHTDKYRGIHIF